jgi:hypothetical protein
MCSFRKPPHMPQHVLAYLYVTVMGMASIGTFAAFFRTSFTMFMFVLSAFFSAFTTHFFAHS